MQLAVPTFNSSFSQVADMLTETRAELDEFHVASKELEQELENELQRTEKAQQDLKVKVARAESEREDWKVRVPSLIYLIHVDLDWYRTNSWHFRPNTILRPLRCNGS